MSTEAGATRRRAKEGFAVNGSSEDFLDGMKVQCSMANSRNCNVLFQDCYCSCISSLSYIQDRKIFLGRTAFENYLMCTISRFRNFVFSGLDLFFSAWNKAFESFREKSTATNDFFSFFCYKCLTIEYLCLVKVIFSDHLPRCGFLDLVPTEMPKLVISVV